MSDFAGFSVDPDLVLRRGEIEADRETFGAEPERPRAVDPEAFKAAMRVLAAGVVMVTASKDGELHGLTISACCSISAAPPQVLMGAKGKLLSGGSHGCFTAISLCSLRSLRLILFEEEYRRGHKEHREKEKKKENGLQSHRIAHLNSRANPRADSARAIAKTPQSTAGRDRQRETVRSP